MSADALSAAQFGGTDPSAGQPAPQGVQIPQPIGNAPQHEVARPLSLGANTTGSVKQAAAWHKPTAVMPLSAGTTGSLFNPNV